MDNQDCNVLNEVACEHRLRASEAIVKDSDLILYLFGCRVAWLREHDGNALERLLMARQAEDTYTRSVAQWLLHGIDRSLPPPAWDEPVSRKPITLSSSRKGLGTQQSKNCKGEIRR